MLKGKNGDILNLDQYAYYCRILKSIRPPVTNENDLQKSVWDIIFGKENNKNKVIKPGNLLGQIIIRNKFNIQINNNLKLKKMANAKITFLKADSGNIFDDDGSFKVYFEVKTDNCKYSTSSGFKAKMVYSKDVEENLPPHELVERQFEGWQQADTHGKNTFKIARVGAGIGRGKLLDIINIVGEYRCED